MEGWRWGAGKLPWDCLGTIADEDVEKFDVYLKPVQIIDWMWFNATYNNYMGHSELQSGLGWYKN